MTATERNAVAVEVIARAKVYLRELADRIDVNANEDGYASPEDARCYYIGKKQGLRVAEQMIEHHADRFHAVAGTERRAVVVAVLTSIQGYLRELADGIDIHANPDGFQGTKGETGSYYWGKKQGLMVAQQMLEHHAGKF